MFNLLNIFYEGFCNLINCILLILDKRQEEQIRQDNVEDVINTA
jgi:hypothetical protein